jgi:hypothetical protein
MFLVIHVFLWPRTQISVPKPSLYSIWEVTALTGARDSSHVRQGRATHCELCHLYLESMEQVDGGRKSHSDTNS